MKMKTVATCSPMVLCLVAGAAHADLSPFSFGASETLQHDSNILHSDVNRIGAWVSSTELDAALNQPIGRETLKATASVNADRYSKLHSRNSEGYAGSGELDWSTVGDLSGALGADSRRRQYLYGLDGDTVSGASKNLETDNHAFARVQLGGLSRWTIFGGFDATGRQYSDPTFDIDEVRQVAYSGGTSYATSPDLSFGLQGRYVRGKYPHVILSTGQDQFSIRTLGANTRLTASGNTSFDANIGYTRQHTDGQPDQQYVNGGINWRWTPPSHFKVVLGATRDSNTGLGTGATVTNTNDSVNGRSLNTVAHLDIAYELTAKINLDLLAQYIHRRYSDALLPTSLTFSGQPVFVHASGASNTARFTLSMHYTPTRTTTLGCGYARELHTSDQSIAVISVPYTDNKVTCTAGITFD
jgi:hypothetical protein